MVPCRCWICSDTYILYYVHNEYVVLCAYGAMYMLDLQCYVQVVPCACCTYHTMYIWSCVHDCISGVVCMWCCVRDCTCGIMCMW